MSENSSSTSSSKKNLFTRFLNFVEWLGNLLPHPVTLFAIFALLVIVFSGIADSLGWSAIDPRPENTPGRPENGIIEPVNLLNAEGFRRIVTNLVSNFTSFAPLGVVLVALLGVGVAERSGLISAAIRLLILKAVSFSPAEKRPSFKLYPFKKHNLSLHLINVLFFPIRLVLFPFIWIFYPFIRFLLIPKNLVTIVICFACILSNTASEMGYVVLVPMGAYIFYSMGRHPLAGLACTFACVSGGYSANLLIGTIDPLLAGLTQEAARLIDQDYEVHAAVNYYFMSVSTFLITAIGAFVTLKIVEPKLEKYDPSLASEDLSGQNTMSPLTEQEKKGLKYTALSVVILGLLAALTVIPENGILRNPATGEVLNSPFLRGMVTLIFVFFLIPGYVYGRVSGSMKGINDIIDGMAKSMSTLGLYIVIVFFAAQFVAFFGWSNLGQIFAIKGSEFLTLIGFTGPEVFIGFIIVSAFVNLMLGSASAQWAITAPIFVPMLMYIGYSPEVIQAAYRIGDSVTNIITPMMSYFGLILAFATKYVRNVGIGTIISMMLPYSLLFFIGWVLLFYIWIFVFNLPVGPGAPTYYEWNP